MPRKRKSYPELEALRHLLGKVPDHEVAARAGTSTSIVGRFRRSLKIGAYDGYKFGNDAEPAVAKPAKTSSKPKGKVATGTKKGATAAAVTAPAKSAASAPAGTVGRRSRISPFSDKVGQIPDREVAELAGVSTEAVRMYRRRRGIELTVARKAAGETKRAPSRRKSRLDPFFDQLGQVPDAEIAAQAGVTAENVRAYRSRHGIKAEYRERRRVEAKQAKAVRTVAASVSRSAGTGSNASSAGSVSPENTTAAVATSCAFSFQVDGSEETWVVLADDVAKAAVLAMKSLDILPVAGRISSINYIGRALV